MHYHEFRAMSTQILLAAEGQLEAIETGFHQAQTFVEQAEQRFTRFTEQSELSALNRSAGSWFEATPDFFEVVALAADLHQNTHGLFDPGILDALELAGYNRTIDELRQYGAPGAAQAVAAPSPAQFSSLRLDRQRRRILLPAGLRIDLGGIAKGWIGGRAARLLSRWSRACAVDAGGDVFMIGLPQDSRGWRVAIEDPRDAARTLAVLRLPPGAVATSTSTRRRWLQGSQERHHLIDPRTRQPAVSEWISVTALAPSPVQAEVFAKALLIGGPAESSRLADSNPTIEFFAVDHAGKMWGSRHSKEFIDG